MYEKRPRPGEQYCCCSNRRTMSSLEHRSGKESNHTEDNKTKVPIWCPCKVVRVADGVIDKGSNNAQLSANARAIAPRGMALVEWEPDPDRGEHVATTVWYLLDPRKWNKDSSHRAWRFHPTELAKRARAAREERKAS